MNVSNAKRHRLSLGYEEHLRLTKKLKVCSSPPAFDSEVKVSEKVDYWEGKTERAVCRPTKHDPLHQAIAFIETNICSLCNIFVALARGLMELLVHVLLS